MKCIICKEKVKKELIDKEQMTCYICLTTLEQRIEEYLSVNNYEFDDC